jgi:hypothetical protein
MAPESTRQTLKGTLSQMRTRRIYALIQILPQYQDLASRKVSLDIRRYAARLIGLVGYLESIPALERLLARLESRIHGQQVMSFAPLEMMDETDLIPDIRRALAFLSSP